MNIQQSPALWLELRCGTEQRIFEFGRNEAVVTLGAGKHASFRIPDGSPVSAHFEARGPVVHVVRGYAKALTVNGLDIEREALLLGAGTVECEGTRIEAIVHLHRPEGTFEDTSQARCEADPHDLPTEVVAHQSLPYDQQATVALEVYPNYVAAATAPHESRALREGTSELGLHPNDIDDDGIDDDAATHVLPRDPELTERSRRDDMPFHNEKGERGVLDGEEGEPALCTAVAGTVPDFALKYPEDEEEELFEGQPSRHEGAETAPTNQPAPADRAVGIPLEHFDPRTPSASEVPMFLSPGDEHKPKMARRMKTARHPDGRIDVPETPRPKVNSTKTRKPPSYMAYLDKLGVLAGQEPVLVYGGTAICAFCLSLMLLGVGSLGDTDGARSGSTATRTASKDSAPQVSNRQEGNAHNGAMEEQEHASKLATKSQASIFANEADMSRALNEAILHLLAGRYGRAEAAYAALAQKHPEVRELSKLRDLLQKTNVASLSQGPTTSQPVILP